MYEGIKYDKKKHGDVHSFIEKRAYLAGFSCAARQIMGKIDEKIIIQVAKYPIMNEFDRGYVDGFLETRSH